MAIAALVELDEAADHDDLLELPWPRPVLRVVPVRAGAGPGRDGRPGQEETDEGASLAAAAAVRRGVDVAARRAGRAGIQRRRRRLALGLAGAGLCVGLAVPVSALGGAAPEAVKVPGTVLTGSTVYVVQPGDTLWSIAARFDHGGDARPLAEEMAKETGSGTVVPGERIAIP